MVAQSTLAIAEEADKAVEKTEEGMLFHNFDADPDDPNKFVWTEVYRRSEDFIFHADNPPIGDVRKAAITAKIAELQAML